jgi:D-beta-D-heptose 7-phosphate kinase/D-beta-D-heptose 1-phosphate adenosyltransferase
MDLSLSKCKRPSIIVIGDIMLDITIRGTCNKLANEAPLPVFKDSDKTIKLGGCGNVAENLAAMGCKQLHLFGRVGTEDTTVSDICSRKNIVPHFIYSTKCPTISKTRYYSGKTLLFRQDNEIIRPLESDEEKQLLNSFKSLLDSTSFDCVVLSDYAKGLLSYNICQNIIKICNSKGIITVVDPKENAAKYTNCTIIKPNRGEVKSLFGIDTSDLHAAHKRIIETCNCKASVITLSEDGISLFEGDSVLHYKNKPAEVIDVTGAGDVVCACIAYLWNNIHDRTKLLDCINFFAMRSIEHIGSYVLRKDDFIAYNTNKLGLSVDLIRQIHSDRKIVFTNGCFDIIHTGHLTLLKQCRELGDIIVVGINSDNSVRRLKGPTRPINSQDSRAELIATLDWVDYVCIFDEDTPKELLQILRPAVLVKGGDYTIDQIIGREYADTVVIIPFVNGYSSTNIINRITQVPSASE